MLTDDEKKNLKAELAVAIRNAYPKDLAVVYAAAVLTRSGNIYSAAQYFSDTYSLTLHGEQCALVHAASHGEGEVRAVGVLSNEKLDKGRFTYPCHMCKQLLYESQRRSGVPMSILLLNQHGEEKELLLDDMMGTCLWPS
jgi:cytidine deaminase